ncbi:structural protein PB1 [Saline Natrinema sp. J7-1 virus 1]|uniref:Structural protein PB1 n=1 Tax=Saline Natrinema sp. J7-1 virus 1 TaxID=2847285 RepID=A0AAE9VSB0_9VIRU|nr:structural protein PB1 [Saline Natrinema sp. J7-1 virus 1]WBE14023.1 structural protein PB1 [Saline Natrinema sp. J7-1 virus 1]
MTYEHGIDSTYGEALADLRDKVGGMTNWSIVDDPGGGGTSLGDQGGGQSEFFVLQAPNGEQVRIGYAGMTPGDQTTGDYDNNWGIVVEHGLDWDPTGGDTSDTDNWNDGQWIDRYGSDPAQNLTDGTDNYGDTGKTEAIAPHVDPRDINTTDSVTYSLHYGDSTGFAIFLSRNVGDGNDASMALGMAQLNTFFNYNATSSRESEHALLLHGNSRSDDKGTDHVCEWNWMSAGGGTCDGRSENVDAHGTTTAYGMPNGHPDYGDYPSVDENVVATPKWTRNRSGQDYGTVIGTHEVWMMDLAGSSNGDTLQDSNANDKFRINNTNGSIEHYLTNKSVGLGLLMQ